MKIRSKIAVMALALVLVTTMSIMGVVFWHLHKMKSEMEQELVTLGIEEAKKVVHNTYLMIEALQAEVEQRLKYNLNAAFALMDRSGPLRFSSTFRSWQAHNQLDKSVQELVLPELVLDGVSNHSAQERQSTDLFIRELSDLIGMTCTLFQRMNSQGDMLRVSTTVPSSNGKSAVGTYIPAVHPDGSNDPVISQVLSGGMFIGRAYVVNDWYNTAYMPLYSQDDGQVIGMLYVGERQSDLVALINAIEDLAVGENGYVFMLESSKINHSRQLVVPGSHDENFCSSPPRHICASDEILSRVVSTTRNNAQPGGITVFMGSDELFINQPHMQNKIVAYSYFAPWDWVIGVCFDHDNLDATHHRLELMMQRTLGWVCAGAFLWFSFALYLAYLLAAQISRPLERAVEAFKNVGRGDLEFQLGTTTGYELEQLYHSFDSMLENLRQVTTSRDELDVEVVARRKVEDKLQQTVATLETIINEAPLSVIVVSIDGKVELWNPAAERMFGWSSEEVVGKVYPLARGEMIAECANNRNIVANGVILRAREVQRYRKDGTKLDLLVSAAAMYPGGALSPDSIIIIHEDISNLKRVQRQLEEREEQYKLLSDEFKSILDGIQDVITVIGPDMKIRWSNHGQKRWNLRNTDTPAEPCYALWNKDRKMCEGCPVVACFETGEMHSAKITSPDGTRWGVKAFPQFDKKGAVMNVIEVASDITESSILREESLRSARLASLGELAAGIAHEINNPNGVIMHNAPILKEVMNSIMPILDDHAEQEGDFALGRMPYSRMRERLPTLSDRILDGSQRIKCIVDDLKNFVREEGSGDQLLAVDLNQAVEAAVRLTANTVKKATRHFNVSYHENLPQFAGSIQRIEQVIVNLIMNSCQALPDMDAAISIETRFNPHKRTIELVVSDEGSGISDENLDKVTNPFFTTKRETGGTGLGLSISSRILEEHQGSMHIKSSVGKGTTIVVSLPCVQDV